MRLAKRLPILHHSCLFCAVVCQIAGLPQTSSDKKSTMSWSQRFFGLAGTRPREQLECRRGCQRVTAALHLFASFVISLHAQFHCLFLQVASHSSCPAFLSCSSVQRVVRLRKSGQGSKVSISSASSSFSLEPWLEVASNFHLLAFKTMRNIFRWTDRSLHCCSFFKVQVSHA